MGEEVNGCSLCDGREEVEIASGIVETLCFGKDENGEYCIWSDKEHDAIYYPRYCPACGRYFGE